MHIRKLVLGLAMACAPLPLLADPIEDFMKAHLERTGVPGAAIAVVRDGVITRVQGFGYANVEHQVPVHPDTVFQSGSIGKMFTAAAVMLMVEDGKLALDAPVRTYLPDAPASWAPITVRQLLNHTSGINGNPGFDLRKDYTEDELLQVFYQAKLDFAPGEKWSYSNTAYALAGILVNKVGGKPYYQVLKERVFLPLGMHTAGVIDDTGIVPNRAAGYENDPDGKLINQRWVAPTGNSTGDGALYLTVLDYVKWDAAVRARKILSAASWRETFTPVKLNSGNTYPYGLGWSLENYAGQPAHGHGGSWQGFRTQYTRFNDHDIALVALTNGATGSPGELVRSLAKLVDPALQPAAGAPIQDDQPDLTRQMRGFMAGSQFPQSELSKLQSEWARNAATRGFSETRTPLGELREVRLFDLKQVGDDTHRVYRGRYAKGFADLVLVQSASGETSSLRLRPALTWDAPVN